MNMERGRTFYISLLCGLAAFALLIVSMNLPAQLTFETKPYARLLMLSGKLDNLTAESLGIKQSDFDIVKNNYAEFLKRNRGNSDSESGDSSDSDEEENYFGTGNNLTFSGQDADNATHDDTKQNKALLKGDSSDSFSSSDEEGVPDSDESSSSEEPSKQQLASAPISQHVGLGLFHGRICEMSQTLHERCHSVSTNEAIYRMSQEVKFMMNDINMAMWNNLRVESIFSALACAIGLLFLFSSLRPCCDNKRLPEYLSALSFSVSGVLVFIPIVRLFLVSSDFQQNLQADYNVTTRLMTSWSQVVSGLASPIVLAAALSILATKWVKVSKKLYHKLNLGTARESYKNGHVVEMSDVGPQRDGKPPAYSDVHNDDVERRELTADAEQ